MIPERFVRAAVFSETLVTPVVMLPYGFSRPSVAFYPEMIVSLNGKIRIAVVGLQTSLRKGYAGRNA